MREHIIEAQEIFLRFLLYQMLKSKCPPGMLLLVSSLPVDVCDFLQ